MADWAAEMLNPTGHAFYFRMSIVSSDGIVAIDGTLPSGGITVIIVNTVGLGRREAGK